MEYLLVEELLDPQKCPLEMVLLGGHDGLKRRVTSADLNRPGLGLAGFMDYFDAFRVQVFGKIELSYLETLSPDDQINRLRLIFEQSEIPCLIVTMGLELDEQIVRLADEHRVPLLRSDLPTIDFMHQMGEFLETRLAPRTSMHGVLMEVFGMGVLITGESGVGKSECAIEMIQRGHRLVADDVVDISRGPGGKLMGSGAELIKHHMEIRGLGIINIRNLYGVSAIREEQNVDLIVFLENWIKDKEYDRLGLEDHFKEILGVRVPHLLIPVQPGRSLSIIIEVGAMNQRLKDMGMDSAKEFNNRLMSWLQAQEEA